MKVFSYGVKAKKYKEELDVSDIVKERKKLMDQFKELNEQLKKLTNTSK